jgi:hypothetical protein
VIALELPVTLEEAWIRAVQRLPEISVIFYPDDGPGEAQAVYVPIEPADPFTEAIRTGLETGARLFSAIPTSGSGPLARHYPDSYAIRHIGLAATSRPIASTRSRVPRNSRATPPASRGSCRGRIRWLAC